jgi:hypothetical protein
MEFLSDKFKINFNSVQIVVYPPDGIIEEANHFVGMNWHADDEQYLSGPNKEQLDEIAIATLNIFSSTEDTHWCFNVRPKGI